jgi:MFS family permease
MDINLNSSPVVVGDNKHRHEKVTQVTFSQPNCPLNRTSDPDVLTTITSNGFYEDSSQIISTNVAISHEIITNDVDPSSSSIFANLEEHEDYLCGLGSFRPKWSQCLANKQSFLTMFCLTSVLQGMYYTYFVSVLTTIEKLFQIQSKTTGILMSATEIGQIGGALLLSYYGGQGDRPKWISGGMLIFAFASLICSTPHFLFGGQSLLSNMASMSPSSSNQQSSSNFGRGDFSQSLCLDSNHNFSSLSANLSTFVLQDSNHPSVVYSKCEDNDLKTAQSQITSWVLGIFFLSLFLIGIGTTAVNTLGIPYIDDNVASRESPLYMGITIGVRIFGPVLGFLLGSICTSIYVDFPFGKSLFSFLFLFLFRLESA